MRAGLANHSELTHTAPASHSWVMLLCKSPLMSRVLQAKYIPTAYRVHVLTQQIWEVLLWIIVLWLVVVLNWLVYTWRADQGTGWWHKVAALPVQLSNIMWSQPLSSNSKDLLPNKSTWLKILMTLRSYQSQSQTRFFYTLPYTPFQLKYNTAIST